MRRTNASSMLGTLRSWYTSQARSSDANGRAVSGSRPARRRLWTSCTSWRRAASVRSLRRSSRIWRMASVVPAPKIASSAKKITSRRVRVLPKIAAQRRRVRARTGGAAVLGRGTLGSPSASSGIAAASNPGFGGGTPFAMSADLAMTRSRFGARPRAEDISVKLIARRFPLALGLTGELPECKRPRPNIRAAGERRACLLWAVGALGVAACGPGDRLEREGRVRREVPAALLQLLPQVGVESGRVGAGGADPERERLPPLVEARKLHPDGQLGLGDVVESGGFEQLGQVASAGARERGFVPSAGIELTGGGPEHADRGAPTGEVPDAGDDDPAGTRDPRHLAQAADRIRHEVHDELREGDVELGVGEGQLLRGRTSDGDSGMALAGSGHELLRRVDGRDRFGAEPRHELPGQGAGAAPDVQRPLPTLEAREVGKPRRQPSRVTPHEAVVRIGGDEEAHLGRPRPRLRDLSFRPTKRPQRRLPSTS